MKTISKKNNLFSYLGIRLSDLQGMAILCVISFALTLFQSTGYWRSSINEYSFQEMELPQEMTMEKSQIEQPVAIVLKPFNPNTVDIETLEGLGLPAKTARTWINYRNKGGIFRKKEDVKKVYGMKEEIYVSLEPYIQLEPQTKQFGRREINAFKQSDVWTIDINEATSESFERLYGIGPFLAKRIVNFREKLGGFYSIEQVGETYGIADTIFEKCREHLILGKVNLRKINVNQADFQTLDAHPYINKKLAEEIIKLREKLGKIEEIESLHSLKNWDKHSFEQVKPYLKLSD